MRRKFVWITLGIIPLLWLGFYSVKTMQFYWFLKGAPAHYSLGLFEADSELGYHLLPGHRGYYFLSATDSVAVCTDAHGRRVSCGANQPESDSALVFIGDSFTFGEACEEDSTFVGRIRNSLHQPTLNLGTGGYGIAQMHLLLNRFRKMGYKRMVIQLSPWLAARANSGYLDSKLIKVPVPELKINSSGKLSPVPPGYVSRLFEFGNNGTIRKYRKTPAGLMDFIQYAIDCGIPLYTAEALGELRSISFFSSHADAGELERAFLKELNHLVEEQQISVKLLLIGYDAQAATEKENELKKYTYLSWGNASAELYHQLPHPADSLYEKQYMHWSRDGKTLLDRHPNSLAHAWIARALSTSTRL